MTEWWGTPRPNTPPGPQPTKNKPRTREETNMKTQHKTNTQNQKKHEKKGKIGDNATAPEAPANRDKTAQHGQGQKKNATTGLTPQLATKILVLQQQLYVKKTLTNT
ncbi:hypothetical protein DSO57_1020263 [Entomophthora muscae]|uniref:Uncharacterized protein n=1 Tax=Entomophthora muscae TaxID=34485 RepID=A0ACC2UPB9_9FUNG|nr:hypothetical protein DSO57_1020263 [Entomophthora muscae]